MGTHALRTYGNMLGVRLRRQALRTQDVDIAQEPAIGVALAAGEGIVDVGQKLIESDLGFLRVPTLDPRRPSTSFSVRGRELRVDFLTPLRGPETSKPLYLPVFRVAATPLRFLDYLIAETHQAVVVGGHGILVNVPDPARFGFHKLWTSQKRPAAEQAKALVAPAPGQLMPGTCFGWSMPRATSRRASRALSKPRRAPRGYDPPPRHRAAAGTFSRRPAGRAAADCEIAGLHAVSPLN